MNLWVRKSKKQRDPIEFKEKLNKISPQKGDIVVFRTTERFTNEAAREVSNFFRHFIPDPDIKFIIIDEGRDLEVISASQTEDKTSGQPQ